MGDPRFAVFTGKVHRFRLGETPLRLRLQDANHEPRVGVEYRLRLELGAEVLLLTGTTGPDGHLAPHPLPRSPSRVVLEVPATGERWELGLGALRPLSFDDPEGVAARLRNLGYLDHDDHDGFVEALTRFQVQAAGMTSPTGVVDTPTLEALRRLHDEPSKRSP